MSDARESNKDDLNRLEKDTVDTVSLEGGVLPRDLFDEFYENVQSESELLDLVRTVDMPRKEMSIPQIGVEERVLREQAEGASAGTFEDAISGSVDLDATDNKTIIPYELTQETVEDVVTGEEVADLVLGHFETQFATDVQDLTLNGDTSSSNSFLSIIDGWIQIAENGAGVTAGNRLSSNGQFSTYDHANSGTPQPVNTELFSEAIQTLEEKYRDPDNVVFLMSKSNVQEYSRQLSSRQDGLGVAILQGENDVTPFEYDVVGVSNFPQDRVMMTDPNNLVWGLHRDVEVDVVDNSDETLERDLFARYALRARWDLNIEDLDAGVIVTGVEDPTL
jgi:hypothetical protein